MPTRDGIPASQAGAFVHDHQKSANRSRGHLARRRTCSWRKPLRRTLSRTAITTRAVRRPKCRTTWARRAMDRPQPVSRAAITTAAARPHRHRITWARRTSRACLLDLQGSDEGNGAAGQGQPRRLLFHLPRFSAADDRPPRKAPVLQVRHDGQITRIRSSPQIKDISLYRNSDLQYQSCQPAPP
jgi:hypothetical protein